MIEPIEGERQCTRCLQCKPISAFSPRNSRCKSCRSEAARMRKVVKPCKSRLRAARPWTEAEDAVLLNNYPAGGIRACMPHLDRTQSQAKSRVERLGLSREIPPRVFVEPEWALPAHDYTPADYALRNMPALADWRPAGHFAPSVGLVMGVAA